MAAKALFKNVCNMLAISKYTLLISRIVIHEKGGSAVEFQTYNFNIVGSNPTPWTIFFHRI